MLLHRRMGFRLSPSHRTCGIKFRPFAADITPLSERLRKIIVKRTILQLVRYAIAGLLVNAFGYTLYLGIAWLSGSPGFAVSVCYPIGILIGYLVHARYSFQYSAERAGDIYRFVVAHVGGYLSNLAILRVGVDVLEFPHEVVQVFAIVIVAVQLFLVFKLIVFKSVNPPTLIHPPHRIDGT